MNEIRERLLKPLQETPPRDPVMAQQGRANFLAEATLLRATALPTPVAPLRRSVTWLPSWGGHGQWAPRLARGTVLATFALAILLGLVGIGLTAQDAVAGDVLYPVKTTLEETQLALTHDDSTRASLHLSFAARRSYELKRLLSEAQVPQVQMTLTNFNDHLVKATLLVQALVDVDAAGVGALQAQLNETVAQQLQLTQAVTQLEPVAGVTFPQLFLHDMGTDRVAMTLIGPVTETGVDRWLIADQPIEITSQTHILGENHIGRQVLLRTRIQGARLVAQLIVPVAEGETAVFFPLLGRVEAIEEERLIVDGFPLQRTAQTAVMGELAVGRLVLVDARVDLDSTLTAERIQVTYEDDDTTEEKALPITVSLTGTLERIEQKQIVVSGQRIGLDATTRIEGTIQVGDRVYVEIVSETAVLVQLVSRATMVPSATLLPTATPKTVVAPVDTNTPVPIVPTVRPNQDSPAVTNTAMPSPTPTATATGTPSPTPTGTATATSTGTPATATATPTGTLATPTNTSTLTPAPTHTHTPTPPPFTPTATATSFVTPTPTAVLPTPTATPTWVTIVINGIVDTVEVNFIEIGDNVILIDDDTLILGNLIEGASVEVEAITDGQTILALVIEVLNGGTGQIVQITGIVTDLDDGWVEVDGTRFVFDDETVIIGVPQVGVEVFAFGVDINGTIMAVIIEVLDHWPVLVSFEGFVDAVNVGSITVDGETILIDSDTVIVGQLAVGVYVFGGGVYDGPNILATYVEVIGGNGGPAIIDIFGYVNALSADSVQVEDVTILLTNDTEIVGNLVVDAYVFVQALDNGGQLEAVTVMVIGNVNPPATVQL